ncbi:MAG: hypothetical protein HZB16_10250 [Armatimonadetes bacterium]|nr:hypothetical protein [Armatimonadota bacterium]
MKQTRRWLCLGAFALVVAGGARWWLVTHPGAPIITYTPTGDLIAYDRILAQTRSGHLATVIRGKSRDTVRLDGRAFDAGGRVSELSLSADGEHVSWLAERDGTKRAYADGRPGQILGRHQRQGALAADQRPAVWAV